jgi:phosphoesterase RecJ-like protein
MPLDWSPFVNLVHSNQRFLLTTHVRPDGDGLGSMLALSETLEALGKSTQLVVASTIPPRYFFLDPERKVRRFELPGDDCRQAEAAIVLDTGTWNQLGDFGTFLRELSVPKLVIDHHMTQDDLGAVRLVDTAAEATGRLVYDAIVSLGRTPSATAAGRLFVALAMDTSCMNTCSSRIPWRG